VRGADGRPADGGGRRCGAQGLQRRGLDLRVAGREEGGPQIPLRCARLSHIFISGPSDLRIKIGRRGRGNCLGPFPDKINWAKGREEELYIEFDIA